MSETAEPIRQGIQSDTNIADQFHDVQGVRAEPHILDLAKINKDVELSEQLNSLELAKNSDFCFSSGDEIIDTVTAENPLHILHAMDKIYTTHPNTTIDCSFFNPENDSNDTPYGTGQFKFNPSGNLRNDIDLILFKIYGKSLGELLGEDAVQTIEMEVPFDEQDELNAINSGIDYIRSGMVEAINE